MLIAFWSNSQYLSHTQIISDLLLSFGTKLREEQGEREKSGGGGGGGLDHLSLAALTGKEPRHGDFDTF